MELNQAKSAHSEVHQLNEVYLKSISAGMIDQDSINSQWSSLNYLSAPVFDEAIAEYADFQDIIEKSGSAVKFFTRDNKTGMDSIYCRDASIVTDFGIIICNMGKALRSTEPGAHRSIFESNGENILGVIESPGTVEGGDVAWIDQNTLAVGHGYRTNSEGIRQLENLVSPHGINIVQVPLPHHKGPEDVFHLMSIFSPVDDNLAVVYSPLMPVIFRNLLLERAYELVEVDDDEFESMGCNVLALAPRQVVMVEGNDKVKAKLENLGCTVYEYAGENISVLGGGGPTCLTRPTRRLMNG